MYPMAMQQLPAFSFIGLILPWVIVGVFIAALLWFFMWNIYRAKWSPLRFFIQLSISIVIILMFVLAGTTYMLTIGNTELLMSSGVIQGLYLLFAIVIAIPVFLLTMLIMVRKTWK